MANIVIKSRDQAIEMLENKKYNQDVTAIVSISDPNKGTPKIVKKIQDQNDKIILVLHFDDMEKEMINNPRCRGWQPPQEKHIKSIIHYANDILNSGGTILCHCNAGISRSAAAAYILKCIDLGEGKEEEALSELLKNRDYIAPNRLMIELAQDIFGKNWDLLSPLDNIQEIRKQIFGKMPMIFRI